MVPCLVRMGRGQHGSFLIHMLQYHYDFYYLLYYFHFSSSDFYNGTSSLEILVPLLQIASLLNLVQLYWYQYYIVYCTVVLYGCIGYLQNINRPKCHLYTGG